LPHGAARIDHVKSTVKAKHDPGRGYAHSETIMRKKSGRAEQEE
jgi:hypothetical protein